MFEKKEIPPDLYKYVVRYVKHLQTTACSLREANRLQNSLNTDLVMFAFTQEWTHEQRLAFLAKLEQAKQEAIANPHSFNGKEWLEED